MLLLSAFQFLAAVRATGRRYLSLSMWAPPSVAKLQKPTAAQPAFPNQNARPTPKPRKLLGSTPKLTEIARLPAPRTFPCFP